MILQWVWYGQIEPELFFNARELAAFLRDECDEPDAADRVEEAIELTERRIA